MPVGVTAPRLRRGDEPPRGADPFRGPDAGSPPQGPQGTQACSQVESVSKCQEILKNNLECWFYPVNNTSRSQEKHQKLQSPARPHPPQRYCKRTQGAAYRPDPQHAFPHSSGSRALELGPYGPAPRPPSHCRARHLHGSSDLIPAPIAPLLTQTATKQA